MRKNLQLWCELPRLCLKWIRGFQLLSGYSTRQQGQACPTHYMPPASNQVFSLYVTHLERFHFFLNTALPPAWKPLRDVPSVLCALPQPPLALPTFTHPSGPGSKVTSSSNFPDPSDHIRSGQKLLWIFEVFFLMILFICSYVWMWSFDPHLSFPLMFSLYWD